MDTIAEPGMPPLEWEPIVVGMVALRWTRWPRVERFAAAVHTHTERVAWMVWTEDGEKVAEGRLPDGPGAIEEAQALCLRVLRAWARQGRT